MKIPSNFSTGDPSYFVVASTPGSWSPIVLTMSKALAIICLCDIRFIDAGL